MTKNDKPSFWKQFLAFEWFWLIVMLVCGTTMVFAMPPFQVMDEYKHFYKSYGIAQGNLVCTQTENGPGFYVPALIRDAGIVMGVQDLEYNYDKKVTPQEIARGGKIHDLGEQVFVQHPFCESPFWSHIPQAFGIKIAQIFSLSLEGLFYAGRLASFLITTLILFFAIRKLPFGKPLFGFVTLLPMFLQQIASYSLDSTHYALLFLFFAMVFALARQKAPYSWQQLTGFGILSLFAIYAKLGYMPLILLIFLLPLSNFSSKKQYWLYMGGILTAHVAAFFLLRGIFSAGDIVNAGAIDRDGQLLWIVTHPLDYAGVLLNTIDIHFDFYWKNMFGIMGWLDYPLHGVHYVALVALLFFLVGGQEKDQEEIFVPWQRWLLLVLVLGNALLLMTLLYAMDDPVAYPVISLMQGKYFLPLFPLGLLALYQLRVTERTRKIAVLVIMAATFPILLWMMQHRYNDTELRDVVPYANVSIQDVTAQKVFRQIFVSRENNLQGISFYLANTEKRPESAVNLLLKDANCEKIIENRFIREGDITIDGYYHYRFPVIKDSKDKQFCFQFHPTLRDAKIPLKVATSAHDVFKDGRATLGDEVLPGDLVMMLGYER